MYHLLFLAWAWDEGSIRTVAAHVSFVAMSSTAFAVAVFVGTSLLFTKSKTKQPKGRDVAKVDAVFSKEGVEHLRASHFSKSVSVSYANSGPLMIVGVRQSWIQYLLNDEMMQNSIAHNHFSFIRKGTWVSID